MPAVTSWTRSRAYLQGARWEFGPPPPRTRPRSPRVLDTNARARRFYEAAGFAPDGGVKVDDRGEFQLREVRYRRGLP